MDMTLKKDQCLAIGPQIRTVCCTEGKLWLTYPGSTDIIISKGEIFEINTAGGVIIQGLCASSCILGQQAG